jgi:hypothetical protein
VLRRKLTVSLWCGADFWHRFFRAGSPRARAESPRALVDVATATGGSGDGQGRKNGNTVFNTKDQTSTIGRHKNRSIRIALPLEGVPLLHASFPERQH